MNLANFGTILRLMLRTGLFGALISAVLFVIFTFSCGEGLPLQKAGTYLTMFF